MNPRKRRTGWLVWGGLILLACTLLLAFLLAQLQTRMFRKPLPVYGQIAEFTLTNQNGRAVSLADLRGHVWVADIIFTRCPGPCMKMSRQMKELQQALPASSQAKLISLTTDADYDTPAVLKAYGERLDVGADFNHWLFLTGRKTDIFRLATNSLMQTAQEKAPAERESANDLFIHSTRFAIVDQNSQLRGVFETTGEGIDPTKVKATILAGIRRLEREARGQSSFISPQASPGKSAGLTPSP